jgi:DNA-binding transcriptional ArsR family regulator
MSSSTNQVAHFLISHYVTYLKELGLITSDKDEEGLKNELSAKLRFLLANVASEKILLHLYHHGRGHLREIVRDHAIGIGGVQKALARLTKGQIIVKRKEGNLVVYSYNDRNPLVSPILELVRITYNSIPQDLRTKIFSPKYTKKE